MSISTVFSAAPTTTEAIAEVLVAVRGLDATRAILFFASIAYDGERIGKALEAAFPRAVVAGCSGNGVFSDRGFGRAGVCAMVLSEELVSGAVAALIANEPSPAVGVQAAADAVRRAFDRPLRALDPARYAGLVFLEGASGREEAINEALGNVAPAFPYVGGSAGDDMRFSRTWVYAGGRLSHDGSVLTVLELRRRFEVLRTCNFVVTERQVTVTRSDPARRLVYELDGQPAVEYFAAATGVTVQDLGPAHFLAHPLGLVIDDEPWLRSPVRIEGGALFFACAMHEGAVLQFMRGVDLVEETTAALDRVQARLGGPARGAVFFNCAGRMMEAELRSQERAYHESLSRLRHVGVHTNGESHFGHLNQTLLGLVFG